MASEIREKLYKRIQAEYDRYRGAGFDKRIILEALSEKYGISTSSLRTRIDTRSAEVAAYTNLYNQILHQ